MRCLIGISLTEQQKLAVRYYKIIYVKDLVSLLQSKVHELRLTALLIMVLQFNKAKTVEGKENIFAVYLINIAGVNNWDLVDTSASSVLGAYLFHQPETLLYDFVLSGHLWKQRIAIIATLYFIRQKRFEDTLAIVEILLHPPHDLIHKATGWMLWETGQRDPEVLLQFLKKHYQQMPRTALR